jgi:hypothetical protein
MEAARATLAADPRRVEERQRRYADAIATASDVAVLAKALQDRERQRIRLQGDRGARHATRASAFDDRRVEKALRAKLKDWRETLQRQEPAKDCRP